VEAGKAGGGPIGQGELVYSGAPLAFCCFHRGPTTAPLMDRVINHLSGGRAFSRLGPAASTVGEAAAEGPPLPAAPPPAGRLPAGLELVEAAADGPYNVSAQVKASSGGSAGEAVLVLDGQFDANGKAARACLWLALLRDRLELRGGKAARSGAIASARWQPPALPTELTVRRRLGFVSVMSGDRELLRGKTALKPGGMIGEQRQQTPQRFRGLAQEVVSLPGAGQWSRSS
jgi:hypothetical protein